MQLFSEWEQYDIKKTTKNKNFIFLLVKTQEKPPSKVADLWQFGFFFSAATTAQNTPEFILEMWLKIPLSATLVLTHLINSSFYHLFLLFSLFMSEFVFPIFAKIVYQKLVFEIRAINIRQTIQFFPMHHTRKV